MVKARFRVRTLLVGVFAACAVMVWLLVLVVAASPPPPPMTPRERAVAAVKAAFRKVRYNLRWGVSPDAGSAGNLNSAGHFIHASPFAPVMLVLRHEGRQLPKVWRARVLGRYASYCLNFWDDSNRNVAYTRYEKKAVALLEKALHVDPYYSNNWVRLAGLATPKRPIPHALTLCTAMALYVCPRNPIANLLRASLITGHGRFVIPRKTPGGPAPRAFFSFTPKFARAYCYRMLMYRQYRMPRRGTYDFWFFTLRWRGYWHVFEYSVERYEPSQVKLAVAGAWKPGPSPDPWPPKKLVREAILGFHLKKDFPSLFAPPSGRAGPSAVR